MNPIRNVWRIAALVLAAAAGWPSIGVAQLVDIATGPIFAAKQAHPNVAVTTSVEFPTVGAAYLNLTGYSSAAVYLGYFDASKCYSFDTTYNLFKPSSTASTSHTCADTTAFSGNFMNWVTMSAIDEFRYAITGGNRVSETGPNNGTVLQRATLPDGTVAGVPSFYNLGSNFPGQDLNGYGGGAGLIPATVYSGGGRYIGNCGIYVYFVNGYGGSCNIAASTGPGGVVAAYPVRVLVCDDTEGPVRSDLCLQYGAPTGKYKPVGQAQVNADHMRFASFGYLMDRNSPGYTAPCNDSGWNRCRYGGVLRSPMKYVGPTQYDGSLIPSANPKSEINPDGTLNNDPEGNAATFGGSYSGFINFINKFGASGVYKRFDTMGEMYYEAIRYFQGPSVTSPGPTPDAVAGTINFATADYFPYLATWSDPIITSCSANYIINLSDANTWDDTYLPGYSGSPSPGYGRPYSRPVDGGLDAYLWTARIGALESDPSSYTLTANDHRPGLNGLQNWSTGAGTASYLPAGAAFWANVNDIRPDLPGKQTIKTISFDVAEPSIDIHDRQLYLMGKYGGFNNTIDRPSDTFANPFYASDPVTPTTAIRSNSEWEDSPGSGYPANYLLASDPQKLINGLRAAFARISAATGTLSGASLTSANLTYGAANAYIATFNPARWSGSVLQKSLSVDPMTGDIVVSTGSIWDAGPLLTARCGTVAAASLVCSDTYTGVGQRNIVTSARVGGLLTPVNFTMAALAVDASWVAALNLDPVSHLADGRASQRLNFLRGFRANEAGTGAFRLRDSVMGDVINSGPIYVGPPSTSIPDSDYLAFYLAHSARQTMVYVGANDGMLHGLSSIDGSEVFAYVPEASKAYVADLTNPAYVHEVFVDTVPRIQEAKVGTNWKTVLIGANGNGAQAIFALDVSDPASFGPSNVLFEFSDSDDADLGSVLAQPEIAKLKVGISGGVPVYKYFAVVTGYNNKRTAVNGHAGADTNVSTDTANQGVLFLLSLDHVLGTAWVAGTDYYKFKFPATNPAVKNGLGPVTLLQSRSGDGSIDAMYFGDLQGNLWRFNTNTGDPTTWVAARGTAAVPAPIFVATDGSGTRQPITARPELGSGPFGSVLVFFGTGEYLGVSDLSLASPQQQSEYAFLDTGSTALVTRAGDLVQRVGAVAGGLVTVTGAPFSYSGPSSKKGWYLDFPSSSTLGERSITKPALGSGVLTFTSLTLTADICGSGGGFIYQVNALTGLAVGGASAIGYTSTVGIPGPPRIVDLTLTPGVERTTGETIDSRSQAVLVSGTTPTIARPGAIFSGKTPPVGRINWREISNWNDLTHH